MKKRWLRWLSLGAVCCPQLCHAVINGTWVPTAAGTQTWTTSSNWSPATFPGQTLTGGDTALFGSGLLGNQTVNLANGAPLVLQQLTINCSTTGSNYTINPSLAGDSLTFLAISGNPSITTLTPGSIPVNATISAPIAMTSPTQTLQINCSTATGTLLTLSGLISDAGGGLA